MRKTKGFKQEMEEYESANLDDLIGKDEGEEKNSEYNKDGEENKE